MLHGYSKDKNSCLTRVSSAIVPGPSQLGQEAKQWSWEASSLTGLLLLDVVPDMMLTILCYDLCKTWQEETQMSAANQPTSQISKISTFLRLRWFLIMIPSPKHAPSLKPGSSLGSDGTITPWMAISWMPSSCPLMGLGPAMVSVLLKYPNTPVETPSKGGGIGIICFALNCFCVLFDGMLPNSPPKKKKN